MGKLVPPNGCCTAQATGPHGTCNSHTSSVSITAPGVWCPNKRNTWSCYLGLGLLVAGPTMAGMSLKGEECGGKAWSKG